MAARNARLKEGLTVDKLIERKNETHKKKVARARAMIPNVNIEPLTLPDIKVRIYFHTCQN